ncbi:alpha-(1,3)-fucosyltransferase 10-like isoform X2 [Pectinophora gossypiella]|nr:alpha-(1,3)-fucosyltransferase 10-like isoform X2 [Pectinophora gossypiella]
MTRAKKSAYQLHIQKRSLITVFLILFLLFCTANVVIYDFGMIKKLMSPAKNHTRYPTMVWYTRQLIKPLQSTITCYEGDRCNHSKVFNCSVYHNLKQTVPHDPEAYLFYGYDLNRFPLPRNPKTIWGLFYDESPKLKPMMMFEKALNLFNFSMTFSRHSDVPLLFSLLLTPYINSLEYYVTTSVKKNVYKNYAPIVFFQQNCATLTEREAFVEELQKYIDIDSYGPCLNNKDLPTKILQSSEMLDGRLLKTFLARYRFQISIENAVCTDYVTEKLWRSLEIGVVPIYFGSPLIRDWLPNNKSAILVEDFRSPKLLSEYLHYLLKNDTAYEEHLEHKTLRLVSNQRLLDLIKKRYTLHESCEEPPEKKFLCLICERIHAKNSTRVNIVTKKHYDCPVPPKSALTQNALDPNSTWMMSLDKCKSKLDNLYTEINDSDKTPRVSATSWYRW